MDSFDFNRTPDSKGTAINTITSFAQGSEKIDMASIDANTVLTTDQPFVFILAAAFHRGGGAVALQLHHDCWDDPDRGQCERQQIADLEIQLTGTFNLTGAEIALQHQTTRTLRCGSFA